MKALLTVIILFFGIIGFSQSCGNEEKLISHIADLEQFHAKAIYEGDADALNELMSDDVVVNHPTNQILKEKGQLLQMIKKGIIKYTSFNRSPEKFMVFSDMVIVMGSEVVVPASGAPLAGKVVNRRYTNIWRNEKNTWVLQIRHAHNVCE